MIATETIAGRTNGHHILRLGDTTPERLSIELNGRILHGWIVTNGRYPAGVAAALDDARNAYGATRERVFDGPPPPDMVETVRGLTEAVRTDGTLPAQDVLSHLIDELTKSLAAWDTTPLYRSNETNWSAYITRVLMTLIDGLEEHEAELLSTDTRFQVLIELGYFQPPEPVALADPQEAAAAVAPPDLSTGAEPEPSSDASTD